MVENRSPVSGNPASALRLYWLSMQYANLRVGLLLFAVMLPHLHAVEKTRQTGKFVDIQKKSRDRVLYYLVNTPVTREEPYYEISVQVQNTLYVAEYTPLHASESLPQDWVAGAEVQLRIAGHRLFLVRPEGTELAFGIVKHTVLKPAP